MNRGRVLFCLVHGSEGGKVLEHGVGIWWGPVYRTIAWWRSSQVKTEQGASLALSSPAYGTTNSIMGFLSISYYLSKDMLPNVIHTWIQGLSLQYMNFREHIQTTIHSAISVSFSFLDTWIINLSPVMWNRRQWPMVRSLEPSRLTLKRG